MGRLCGNGAWWITPSGRKENFHCVPKFQSNYIGSARHIQIQLLMNELTGILRFVSRSGGRGRRGRWGGGNLSFLIELNSVKTCKWHSLTLIQFEKRNNNRKSNLKRFKRAVSAGRLIRLICIKYANELPISFKLRMKGSRSDVNSIKTRWNQAEWNMSGPDRTERAWFAYEYANEMAVGSNWRFCCNSFGEGDAGGTEEAVGSARETGHGVDGGLICIKHANELSVILVKWYGRAVNLGAKDSRKK